MNCSMALPRPSKEVQSLDDPRPSQAKAYLDSPAPSINLDAQRLQRLGECVKQALAEAHGSGQAAALTIGIDQSQVNRQIRIGTFELRALSAGGDAALANLGERLIETFGGARKTPQQEVAELINDATQKLSRATQIALKLEGK